MKLTEEEYTALLARGTVREVGTPLIPAPPGESENRFLGRVLTLAKQHGWTAYHVHDSRKSAPGFPDVVLVKPGHALLCVELKTNTGKPSMEQLQWLRLLQRSEKPQAAIWRPRDWNAIVAILSERIIPCPISGT